MPTSSLCRLQCTGEIKTARVWCNCVLQWLAPNVYLLKVISFKHATADKSFPCIYLSLIFECWCLRLWPCVILTWLPPTCIAAQPNKYVMGLLSPEGGNTGTLVILQRKKATVDYHSKICQRLSNFAFCHIANKYYTSNGITETAGYLLGIRGLSSSSPGENPKLRLPRWLFCWFIKAAILCALA